MSASSGNGPIGHSALTPTQPGAPMRRLPRRRDPVTRQIPSGDWPTVSVVVPAMNEARNLPHVLSLIPSNVHEVVLVDGRSTDDTVDIATRALPGIVVVRQGGRGKGNALAEGFAACTGEIIVMLDADGSADPREIPLFVGALMAGADFAKGSRAAVGGGSADLTTLRRLGNMSLRSMVNILFGTSYTDLCYGYNAFWRHCLHIIDLDCDGFEVETLIHLRVARAGLRIAEVPSYELCRIHGASNLRVVRDGTRILRTIVRERRRSRDTRVVRGLAPPLRGTESRADRW